MPLSVGGLGQTAAVLLVFLIANIPLENFCPIVSVSSNISIHL